MVESLAALGAGDDGRRDARRARRPACVDRRGRGGGLRAGSRARGNAERPRRDRRPACVDRRDRGGVLRPASRARETAERPRRGKAMTALRKLNARGVAAFRDYLQSIRAGSEFQSSPALLYVDEFSSPIQPRIEIAPRRFTNKLD